MNSRIRKIAEAHGAIYFDRVSLLCPQHHCRLLDDDLKYVLYDYGHTTMRGAKYVASRLLRDEAFMDFVSPPTTQSSQGAARNLKAASGGGIDVGNRPLAARLRSGSW